MTDLSSSNNQLLKNIGTELIGDQNLEKLYNMSIADQKNKLKTLFTQITDNNATGGEKAALQAGADTLINKLAALEAKMTQLKKEIDEKSGQINALADEITDLATAAKDKADDMENHHRDVVARATSDVFDMYKNGTIKKDAIVNEISERIRRTSKLSKDQAAIEKILGNLDSKKNLVDNLSSQAADLIDRKTSLETQYNVNQSAWNLINRTIQQIGNTDTTFKNSDYDTKTPIYSIEKTNIATELFDNKKINVKATNSNFKEGTSKATPESINQKYSKYFATTNNFTDYQGYTSANDAYSKLNNAIEAGLLQDLTVSGMSQKDMAKFFATNFAGANIKLTEDGGIDLPVGQDSAVTSTIDKVKTFFENNGKDFLGVKNTWDKDQGNTIDSNAQIKALSENYASVINQLANGKPPFSFKEAMYILFDKDNGIFKDSGITYDLTKQGSEPNYQIAAAGDEATNSLYKNISKLIYDEWGVEANGPSAKVTTHEGPKPPAPPSYDDDDDDGGSDVDDRDYQNYTSWVGVDPLTFRVGDSEYAFIVDRDNDGTFSDMEEFAGAKEGKNWLEDLSSFDYNNDGIIDEKDVDENGNSALSQLKLLGSKYTDNKVEDKKGDHLHGTENEIAYSMQSAESLGITKIDLSEYFDSNTKTYQFDKVGDRAKDVFGNDKEDINGNQVFNDGFKVTFENGDTADTKRKDDGSAFMDTVYGKAVGKSFQLGVSEEEADKLIENGYQKGHDTVNKLVGNTSELEQSAAVLAGYGTLKQEVRTMYNSTNERIRNEEQASLLKASNKARSLTTVASWSQIQSEIRAITASEGIVIDMEQAKGIYNKDSSLNSGRDVVNKYKEQVANEKQLEQDRKTSDIAWEALIKCFKNGIQKSSQDIKNAITEHNLSTSDDVVAYFKKQEAEKPKDDANQQQ